MVRRPLCLLFALAAVLAVLGMTTGPAQAQPFPGSPSNLFYNYYAPAGSPYGVTAAMYPSPRPTPPLVGHTYITYQPLMPQEFLYQHSRVYVAKDPCAGHCGPRTITTVSYGHKAHLWPFPNLGWSVPALKSPPPMGGPCLGGVK